MPLLAGVYPGGAGDADESPYDAAVRELQEEFGLSVPVGRLLVVNWVPARPGRTEGVMFVYDGGVLDGTLTEQIHLPPDELRGWAWGGQCRIQWHGGEVRMANWGAILCPPYGFEFMHDRSDITSPAHRRLVAGNVAVPQDSSSRTVDLHSTPPSRSAMNRQPG